MARRSERCSTSRVGGPRPEQQREGRGGRGGSAPRSMGVTPRPSACFTIATIACGGTASRMPILNSAFFCILVSLSPPARAMHALRAALFVPSFFAISLAVRSDGGSESSRSFNAADALVGAFAAAPAPASFSCCPPSGAPASPSPGGAAASAAASIRRRGRSGQRLQRSASGARPRLSNASPRTEQPRRQPHVGKRCSCSCQ